EREQPQDGPGQRDHDPVASALDRPASQRREHTDRGEPAYYVVANGYDRGLFGPTEGSFQSEQAGHGRPNLIEARAIRPWALGTVKNDRRMNESGFQCAQFLGFETVQLQEAGPLVCKEYIGPGQQLIKPGAILLRIVQYRRSHADLHIP